MAGLSFDPISAGVNLLGSIGQGISSWIQSKKQIQYQQQENERNRTWNSMEARLAREFSADEAQKARDYNTEMVNQQNAYNSPAAMMKRLKAAGLNPNLVYGDIGAASSVGVGSTSMQGSSSSAGGFGSVGTSLPSFSNVAKDMAETELLKAKAKEVNSRRGLTDKEIQWYDQLKAGELKLMGVNISVGESVKKLNDSKVSEIAKNIEVLNTQIELFKSEISNLDQDTSKKLQETIGLMLDNKYKSDTFDMAVRKFAAETSISETEASTLLRAICSAIALNESHASLNNQFAKESQQKVKNLIAECGNIEKLGIKLDYDNDLLNIQVLDEHTKDGFKRGKTGSWLNGFSSSVGDILRNLLGGIVSSK